MRCQGCRDAGSTELVSTTVSTRREAGDAHGRSNAEASVIEMSLIPIQSVCTELDTRRAARTLTTGGRAAGQQDMQPVSGAVVDVRMNDTRQVWSSDRSNLSVGIHATVKAESAIGVDGHLDIRNCILRHVRLFRCECRSAAAKGGGQMKQGKLDATNLTCKTDERRWILGYCPRRWEWSSTIDWHPQRRYRGNRQCRPGHHERPECLPIVFWSMVAEVT